MSNQQEVSTVPQIVNITHYGGDTLTISISAPASLTDGMTWLAQVKATRETAVVDATFDVIAPTSPGGIAYIVLPSETVADLVDGAPAPSGNNPRRYVGEYDCQVSDNGADPVTTLVQGRLTIQKDVSRSP